MSDNMDPNDIDPGEPITELANVELTTSDGFFDRLRGRLQRRLLSAEFVDASCQGLTDMFREFWAMIMSLFAPADDDQRGDRS